MNFSFFDYGIAKMISHHVSVTIFILFRRCPPSNGANKTLCYKLYKLRHNITCTKAEYHISRIFGGNYNFLK